MFTCSFIVNGQRMQLTNLSLDPYVQIDRNLLLRLIANDPNEINDDILNIAAQVVQQYPDASQIYVRKEEETQKSTGNPQAALALLAVAFVFALLFVPIIMAFGMHGKLLLKGVYQKVLKTEEFKKFRGWYLVLGFVFMAVCIASIVVGAIMVDDLDFLINIGLYSLAGGNIVYLIISIAVANGIYKKHPELEEQAQDERPELDEQAQNDYANGIVETDSSVSQSETEEVDVLSVEEKTKQLDYLKKLHEMKEMGIISDEEYEKERAKVFEKINEKKTRAVKPVGYVQTQHAQNAGNNVAKPEPKENKALEFAKNAFEKSKDYVAKHNPLKKKIPEKFKLFDLFYVSGNLSLCLLAALLLFFLSILFEGSFLHDFVLVMSIIGWSLSAVVIAVVLLLLFKKTKEDKSFMFRMISAVANLILSLYWIGLCVGLFIEVDFFGYYHPIILPVITVAFSVIALLLLVSSFVCIISLFMQKQKEADGEIKKNIKPMPKVLTLAIPLVASLCMIIGSAAYSTTPMDVIDGSTLTKVYNKNINIVDIPSSVTSIGNEAFYNCSSLTSVTIPSSVTSIGNGTFRRCSSLTSVTIPSSVTSIGSSAFYYCSSLKSVTIPSSVTFIGDYAFSGCSSLTSVYCEATSKPNGWSAIWKLGCDADVYWAGIKELKGTAGLAYETLSDGTYSVSVGSARSESKIVIPAYRDGIAVTSIGNEAFEGCSSLASVTIPSSVTSIGNEAFHNCSSLASVTIPSSVTSIGSSAFYYCSSLKSVTIPSSVTSIGEKAFFRCSSLKSVTIPSSVTFIGDYAFSDCSSLTDIYYSGTQDQWNAIYKGSYSIPKKCVIHYES